MVALIFLNYVCLVTQLNGFSKYKTTEWVASFPCRLFPLPVLDHSNIVCKYRFDVVTSWHLNIRKERLPSKKRRESSRNCFKPEKRTVSQLPITVIHLMYFKVMNLYELANQIQQTTEHSAMWKSMATESKPTVQDSRAYSTQDALNVVSLSPYHQHHVLLIAIDGSSGR